MINESGFVERDDLGANDRKSGVTTHLLPLPLSSPGLLTRLSTSFYFILVTVIESYRS